MIHLLLKEWDAERGIRRASKYSGFDADKKAEFLSAIAYYLTYGIRGKTFSEEDLIGAYENVYKPFNLPKGEAAEVAREIESHTGIIMAGQKGRYEFCHLSLQEYLAANYIVRAPIKSVGLHISLATLPL